MNPESLCLMTDSYKLTHHQMSPEGTQVVYSYFEARTGATFNKTVFLGLQYLLKRYLLKGVTPEDIVEGRAFTAVHLGNPDYFNLAMWKHILGVHYGRLPLSIWAVPEGTPVDVNNVLMTVENTDEQCAPLTNHFETLLSHVWGPSTVATLSREIKILIKYYLDQTSDHGEDFLPFMLHDFGYRGVNQNEACGISNMGHLLNFMGTDTIHSMQIAMEYYGASMDGLAYSVPASEHSVMTSLGESGEFEIFKRLLKLYPKGILSVVIDSYNYQRFISEYAWELKDMILARDGKVVFRPDSGEPTATTMDVLNRLDEVFGHEVNKKGFNCLNPKVGVLWGDGIDYNGIRAILFAMKNALWSAQNIVFGMGGALGQKINRDTQRFAFKSSAQKRNGVWHDIFKNPLDTTKKSKKGKLALVQTAGGAFKTVPLEEGKKDNRLVEVFRDGELLVDWNFKQLRENAAVL